MSAHIELIQMSNHVLLSYWSTFIFYVLKGHSITTWTRWRRGEGGQKMSVFVHAQGIKTVHAGGGRGFKKWQNSVQIIVISYISPNIYIYARTKWCAILEGLGGQKMTQNLRSFMYVHKCFPRELSPFICSSRQCTDKLFLSDPIYGGY